MLAVHLVKDAGTPIKNYWLKEEYQVSQSNKHQKKLCAIK
jgi:hypothetical protein